MPSTNNFKSEIRGSGCHLGHLEQAQIIFSEIFRLSGDRSRNFFPQKHLILSVIGKFDCRCCASVKKWRENNFVGYGYPYSRVRILSYFDFLFYGSFRGIQSGQYKVNVVLSVRTLRGVREFEDDQGFISNFVNVFNRKTKWTLLRVLIVAFELA